MSDFATLDLAVHAAKNWLEQLDNRSVAAIDSADTLRKKLGVKLNQMGVAPELVIDDLVEATKNGLLGSAGGRFFAWVIGGSLPSALAADWLVSTWDQNAALYACSPAASVVEEIAGEWIKELLDLPRESSFSFTTGCQLAHFTCLAAARAAVLRKCGWDVNEVGLFGAPAIRVLTSEQRHGSVDRAVRYLGLGNRSLQALKTDDGGRILVDRFRETLTQSHAPTIVVLNAADLNVAAFDAFDQIIPLAKAAGAWVHIDGAFGLFARASEQKHYLTKGIELADSWATDCHKWLNVPFDCGVAIVRDRDSHREAMTISASYIAPESEARDQIDWNPEWSRRARGFSVYAALRELGKSGVADLVDRTSAHCFKIVTELGKLPGVEVLCVPQLNQGLVRFLHPSANATEADHAARTREVIAAINKSGEAFFSATMWNGKHAMRVSVVNWRTTDEDVERTIRAVRAVIEMSAREVLSLSC